MSAIYRTKDIPIQKEGHVANRMKRYIVTQPFSISYEGGKQNLEVGPGDMIDYDGVNFQVGDVRGSSSSLKVAVREGEWLQEADGDEEAEDPDMHDRPVVNPARTYNAMGGRQVEQSDPAIEQNFYKGRTGRGAGAARVETDDLGQIVREYESQSYSDKDTVVQSDMDDIRGEIRAQNGDARVAATVSESTRQAAESSDGAITLAEDIEEGHLPVVEGQRVVKETAPPPEPAEKGRKHLVVEGEAGGVEVAKVTDRGPKARAKQNAEARKRQVVQQNTVAKKASTPASKKGTVSAPNSPQVEVVGNPEAREVAKVTRRPEEDMSKGAMRSKLTSGSADEGIDLGDDLDVSDIL